MLPLIDMANHSFAPNCQVQSTGDGVVSMTTLQQVEQGQPLCLSYGELSNHSLLLDYGFFEKQNPHDRIALPFRMDLLQVRL